MWTQELFSPLHLHPGGDQCEMLNRAHSTQFLPVDGQFGGISGCCFCWNQIICTLLATVFLSWQCIMYLPRTENYLIFFLDLLNKYRWSLIYDGLTYDFSPLQWRYESAFQFWILIFFWASWGSPSATQWKYTVLIS
jgi:hypothetical protein